MIDQHVRARSRRGYTDPHAFQVLRPGVVRRPVRADAEFKSRIHALQYEGLHFLRERLHYDGVLVGAGDDVGTMADQRLQCP